MKLRSITAERYPEFLVKGFFGPGDKASPVRLELLQNDLDQVQFGDVRRQMNQERSIIDEPMAHMSPGISRRAMALAYPGARHIWCRSGPSTESFFRMLNDSVIVISIQFMRVICIIWLLLEEEL